MTQKLLLAESLDLLRQCEIKEYDLDKTKERIRGNGKLKGEISRLVSGYYGVYDQFLRGVEILNYIRHQALDDANPQAAQYNRNLSEFCAGKMAAYMDRCDNVIRKVDEILLPLDQVDLITKEGYVPEDTLYIQDGNNYPLTRKENTLKKEFTLMDGTYILTVKNKDDYSIAAPSVDVIVSVTPQRGSGAEPMRVSQTVPTESGWRKVIGVVVAATLQLEVKCSGIRDAHVDVVLQKWKPANGGGGGFSGGPGESPFAGNMKNDFSSDFAPVSKPTNSDQFGPNEAAARQQQGDYNSGITAGAGGTNAATSAPPQQQWGLPAIPDDDLAALANYNVPHGQLPARGSGGGGGGMATAQDHGAQFGSSPQQQQQQQQDTWAALEHMNVPHVGDQRRTNSGAATRVPDAVEVNPSGLTCKERLQKARNMLNAWPADGVAMVSLPSDQQRIVQSVYALPLPRDLN